ncbi:MAG TPA: ABC transporter substrate-binding protein [Burkholderiales bacterium]|nr:ABC transporter substrate-binding protein [Burkholderiales bacterium]
MQSFIRGVGMLALAAACAGARAAGNEIVVGEIVDQSPAWIEAGRDYVAGAKTYFDLVNSEGGINGRKIVHLVKDGGGKPAEVARVAGEMLGEGHIDVLFGAIGDATMKNLSDTRIAEKQNVVVFAPLTGLAGQRQIRTMRASYAEEAQSLVRYFSGLGLTSFCVVATPGDAQKASLAAVRAAVAAIGRKLSCEASLAEIGGDARQTAEIVRAARPQAVFVLGDTAVVGNFVREFPFKRLGITVGALSLVNSTALLELAGPEAVRGVVITQVVPTPQKESVPVVREHVRAMKKFRDEPPSQLTLEGFIAAKTMVEALRRGLAAKSVRREDVSTALMAIPEATLSELGRDYATSNTGGTRLIDVTMVGGDGRLIQ